MNSSFLGTILFGSLSSIRFYHFFKRYNREDHFLETFLVYPNWLLIIGKVLLWGIKKFPKSISCPLYRLAAFLFGVLMLGVVVLFWGLWFIEP
ncbi:hypothetical protein [Alkalihalobacterium alkalinitrilicum]|uniref:hypothetical protein n=1 Tax=Alkalihalobacterium alkalinitrilicum TaxID=427920 RepID=UPI0009956FC5|nr:hypothetical protein [Alkalihalobacterium alkalinitrilicum]